MIGNVIPWVLITAAAVLGAPPEVQHFVLAQLESEPTTYELWIAALAIITTIVSSIVLAIPAHWNPWAKRAVVAVIALLLSAAGTFYENRLDTEDWARTWIIVFLGATAIYTLISKPVMSMLHGKPAA